MSEKMGLFVAGLFVFLTVLVGCGTSEDANTAKASVNPDGIYNLNFTERPGGSCGAQDGWQVTITSTANAFTWTEEDVSTTNGSMICDEFNCAITVASSVNNTDTSTGETLSGSLSYSVNITSAHIITGAATFSGTLKDSSGVTLAACSSTYDVHGGKLK